MAIAEHRLWWRDMLVIAGCLGLVSWSGVSFYHERFYKISENRKSSGHIIYHYGDTFRRAVRRGIWQQGEAGDEVFNLDMIRTDDNSELILLLSDRTRIELDQQTMIRLVLGEKENELEVLKGNVLIERPAQVKQKFRIKHGRQRIVIRQGKLSAMKIQKKRLALIAHKGNQQIELNINAAGDARALRNIGEGQTALLDSEQGITEWVEQALVIETPPAGERILTNKKNIRIRFSWQPASTNTVNEISPGKKEINPYRVQIAQDISFKKIIKKLETFERSVSLDLPVGIYYWRVLHKQKKAAENKPIFRPPYRFVVQKRVRILMLSPSPQAQYPGPDKTSVRFAWRSPDKFTAYYIIEIFKDAAMQDRVLARKTKLDSVSFLLEPGQYHWRVRGGGFQDKAPPAVSELRSLSIATEKVQVKEPALKLISHDDSGKASPKVRPTTSTLQTRVPLRLNPGGGRSVDMSTRNVLNFKWASHPQAESYEFQLSGPAGIVHTSRLKHNFLSFKDMRRLSEGQFNWQIKVLKHGQTIQQSSARFKITLSQELERPELMP